MQEKIQPKRLLAVGDIHGYPDKLHGLMDQVRPKPEDKVIFLGDYIDRGPDSRGVIEFLIDFRKRFPQTVFLRGNHEQMLLDSMIEVRLANSIPGNTTRKRLRDYHGSISYYYGNKFTSSSDYRDFKNNGGISTLANYGGDIANIPKEHEDFLESCRFWHRETVLVTDETGRDWEQEFIFVHAGIYPDTSMEEQALENLLWLREPFISHAMDFGGAIVVHGHTPEEHVPVFKPHRIGLDSGVYMPEWEAAGAGRLVCCDLISRAVWTQN